MERITDELPKHLFIPEDEKNLRRLQRKVDKLDKTVRSWAASAVNILPRGLVLLPEEVGILNLYLAEQRRKNLELDAGKESPGLGRIIPLFANSNEHEMTRTAHRQVSIRLQSDIDRAFEYFCHDRNIPMPDPSYDWLIAIRLMAQQLYIACRGDVKNATNTKPSRFEFALIARDHSLDVIGKRQRMMALLTPRS